MSTITSAEATACLKICKERYPEEFKEYCIKKSLKTDTLTNIKNAAASFVRALPYPIKSEIYKNIENKRLITLYREYINLNGGY